MIGADSAQLPDDDVEIRRLQKGDVDAAIEAISAQFGPHHDHAWFEWKHRSGPFGESPGWVAETRDCLVGVRMLLPWRFATAEGDVDALRACDTVTVPSARGRGVFRMLTLHALDEVRGSSALIFNTPNAQSRPGYLKMGFTPWIDVKQDVGLVGHGRAAVIQLNSSPPQTLSARTAATSRFLSWRYEQCPSLDYVMLSLEQADSDNGLVARMRRNRGLRILVISELWGTAAERKMLVRSAAARHGTRLVWVPHGQADVLTARLRSASTLVTHFKLGNGTIGTPEFSVGDLEDVI